jgi:hypothetical protein
LFVVCCGGAGYTVAIRTAQGCRKATSSGSQGCDGNKERTQSNFLDLRTLFDVEEHNFPSMRVLEKAGFNKVGIMTTSIFKNGHFTNAHLFELLKNT